MNIPKRITHEISLEGAAEYKNGIGEIIDEIGKLGCVAKETQLSVEQLNKSLEKLIELRKQLR